MRATLQLFQAKSTYHRHLRSLMMLIGILLCSALTTTQAAEKKTSSTNTPVNDVRVLIDISGSMKKNDPANLRQPALNLFLSLLPDNMQSGVWTFGQWVNMLIPRGKVTSQWKSDAKKSVHKINSVGLYTNIEDAIRRSTWDWRNTSPEPNSERNLILLTDGLVDISKDEKINQVSRKNILHELLPSLKKSGVTINAIALSNESDKNLLEQLTTATGGRFETIETAAGLERIFLHLFESVAPSDNLPLTENKVKVDDSIKEMTFLIFRESSEKEGSITSPSGNKYSINSKQANITWHKESHYDLVTIKKPETGYWKVNTKSDPDNRVMVVTDLKLSVSKLPTTLLAGDEKELYVHLENNGEIIDKQDFLHFVKVKLTQESLDEKNNGKKWKLKLYDNGKKSDMKEKDGIYSIKLKKSLVPGEHEIEVFVNGTTFKRSYRKQLIVYNDPATANIEHMSNGALKVSVLPYQAIIDEKSIKITATHKFPNGKKNKVTLDKINPSEWLHEFPTKNMNGEHKVIINVTGISKNGKKIKSTLQPLTLKIKNKDEQHKEIQEKPNKDVVVDDNDEPFSWAMVSLKVGIFNILVFSLIFLIYKYSTLIRKKLTPNLFEEKPNG